MQELLSYWKNAPAGTGIFPKNGRTRVTASRRGPVAFLAACGLFYTIWPLACGGSMNLAGDVLGTHVKTAGSRMTEGHGEGISVARFGSTKRPKNSVPQVLMSVRDVAEAEEAWHGGARWLDIKEPRRGSLGASDEHVQVAIARRFAGRAWLSVAAGELLHFTRAPSIPCWAVKVGLAGCARVPNWPQRFEQMAESLRRNTSFPWSFHQVADSLALNAPAIWSAPWLVAVAYADAESAGAPEVATVLETAIARGWPAVMIDTWSKNGRCLFDYLAPEFLADWSGRLRQAGIAFGLAGSLRFEHADLLQTIAPFVVAFRGAVCRNHQREQSLCRDRVRQLLRRFHGVETPGRHEQVFDSICPQ